MIDKKAVKEIVEKWLEDKEYFLVDVEISSSNCIVVEIDHADGVWIEDCAALSRYIEENLSRDAEDYELEVGSAGLGQPFKVPQWVRRSRFSMPTAQRRAECSRVLRATISL